MNIQTTITRAFETTYNEAPAYIVRAPGRVNLIGEHTDYNDGFVLPMAINRAVWIAFSPIDTPSVTLSALDFDEQIHFDLNDYTKDEGSPAEYVKGMAWALQQAGYELRGWRGVMKGDVPIGAGLSSSAALELAIARAFAQVGDWTWQPKKMAQLAQKAENQWVGVNSGIMDQMISAAGQDRHALLIDCRSLDSELLPLPSNTAVVILDTNTRRELVTSAYNERRQQCEVAARYFGVDYLRDVIPTQLSGAQGVLDPLILRRARHVVTENERVLQAKDTMLADDAHTLGQLMNASHASLRDDFEVTNEALRVIVEIAQGQAGCYGARMTGGGFGGCAVALVDAGRVSAFADAVASAYAEQTPQQATIYITEPVNGAEVVYTQADH
ncbi:MAG: galactokinase [Anaerolineae bacterium]